MLQGWAMTNLSHGGRLALIRSVLQATPLHLLQVIHRPKFVLTTIERIFNGFFRGSYNRRRHIHWSSWAKACFPVAEGGLGVRSLENYVQAFSMKLWWRFQSRSSLWSAYLHGCYVEICIGLLYLITVIIPRFGIDCVASRMWRSHSSSGLWYSCGQLFQDRIPVDARMKQKGFSFPSKCQCCEAEETISHLFVESMAVQGVWQHFAALFGLCLSDTFPVAIVCSIRM
ncbi:UNVERIFIED_CONTAM: hypothetical protein Sradi_4133300 [Sesamum radiatum]|uniref:Reverse transcriptase zinc-binding domain-containing protein n=1 Tax=Sesamum radiatum TaxID=300843 RepID=A0AAW2P506_SESRA